MPVIVIGTTLITIGVSLFLAAFVTTTQRRLALVWSGAFTASYGLRLAMNTPLMSLFAGRPEWLPYFRSALEYLVPIAAALLFQQYGSHWRMANRIATALFVLCAAVGIPIDIITRTPGRVTPVVNAIVVPLMLLIFVNSAMALRHESARELRILIVGAVIFAGFVSWQHATGGNLYIDAPREMVGFLIFIGAIVYVVIRVALRDQRQLLTVRGELDAARAIQNSIIPRTPPHIAQLDVAALYAPATEVGGDFYDFVAIDETRAGFLIADVSGHGVPAALVASMLKMALATQTELATNPAALLARLNDLFRGKLERQFVTAAYVFIDVAASTAVVASAGHPLPLLVRGNDILEIDASGPILGRFARVAFTPATLRLEAGDTIVLYTDGVTEARNASEEQWGDERLHALLRDGAATAQGRVDAIATAVAAWSAVREDDVTLVVVRRESDTMSAR